MSDNESETLCKNILFFFDLAWFFSNFTDIKGRVKARLAHLS